MQTLARILATGFGTGLAPVAPGTFGTLPGVLLALIVAPVYASGVAAGLVTVGAIIAVCIWSADVHARELGVKDPSVVVCDEVAGYVVTVAFLPATPMVLAAGFVLFRLFDITKPPPVRQLEQLPGGTGIVLDDVMAGLMAQAVLRLMILSGLLVV